MSIETATRTKGLVGRFRGLSRLQQVVLVVALIVGIGLGNWGYHSFSGPAPVANAGTLVAVQRGTLTATVSAAGSVVSTKQAKLNFGSAGTVAEVAVAVGDAVKAGQTLAKLDTKNLEIALAQAQANRELAQLKQQKLLAGATAAERNAALSAYNSAAASYDDAVKGATAADLKLAQQAVGTAQSSLIKAQNDLATLQAQPTAESLRQAELTFEQAKDTMNTANVRRDSTCAQSGANSNECRQANVGLQAQILAFNAAQTTYAQAQEPAKAEDLAVAEKAVESAQAGLDAAQAKLAQLQAGPTAATLAAAKSQLDSAKATLEAKVNPPSDSDIALGEESIKQAQAAVDQAELNLQNATIVAPFAGVIGSVGANVGEQVGSGTAMFTLIDPRAVRVDVTVAETDIVRVALGQAVTVTFDALANEKFAGKVVAISPSATVSQGVVNYVVSVNLDPGDRHIPAGLTAIADLVVEQRDGVLMVPNRAVTTSGKNKVVTVVVNEREEARLVEVGMSNDTYTEIVSGVNEGEQVLIRSTSAAAPRLSGLGGMSTTSGVMVSDR